jgi:hypothetical protein
MLGRAMKYKTKKILLIFTIYALLQFLIFTALAMLLYPGGTKYDHDSSGYTFLNNFFSDLGRTLTFNGGEKKASMYLFMVSLVTAGLSTIVYSALFPAFFKAKELSGKFSYGVAVSGIISGLAYIGIALTPWDIFLPPHFFFVRLAFISFMFITAFSIAAIYTDKSYPKIYGAVFIVFGIILTGYLYMLFFGPNFSTPEGVRMQVISQKIVVYSEIICMLIQSFGAYKLLQRE